MRPLVVVLRPLGLGDFLTGVPAYRALARAFPGHRRVLAAPAALEPLARRCGAFDALVPTAPLAELAPPLRGAAVAVDLHGRGPASHRVLLAAQPRRLIAFANALVPESRGGATWEPAEHEVARWCRLLTHAGIAADPADLALAAPPPDPRAAGATVLHPGAKDAARRWPAERFAAVARAERARGRAVVVTGTPDEAELVRAVAAAAELHDDAVLLTPDLDAFAAVVAHAGRVVCGDTGAAHLATAFGTPSVVLFGPLSPALWGPPAGSRRHVALWAGRSGDPHGTVLDPGLASLEVRDVVRALEVLDEGPPVVPTPAGVTPTP